jgi:hypothetical protein
MQLIARDIVLSPLDLKGPELRFLRKRLGKKAYEYCRYLAVAPEKLSRAEIGKQRISRQSQMLARISYCVLSEDREKQRGVLGCFQRMMVNPSRSGTCFMPTTK